MTTPHADDPPQMLPTLRAGSAAHRLLQDSLKALRDVAPDPAARQFYDDILKGRRSARELTSSLAFADSAARALREYEQRHVRLTGAEREEESRSVDAFVAEVDSEGD